MSVKYCVKALSRVVNDTTNGYYSAPELDSLLATGEQFFVTARVTNTSGTSPSITVGIDISNDGANWQNVSAPILGVPLNVGSPTFTSGFDRGTTFVVGRYARVLVLLGGTGSAAYVEVWVCGRSAM